MVAAADNMVLVEGHERPIADVAQHSHPLMIWGDQVMKSFVGFRQKVVFRWLLQAFAGGRSYIFWPVPTIVGTTTG